MPDDDSYFQDALRLGLGKDDIESRLFAQVIDDYLFLFDEASRPISGTSIDPRRVPNLDQLRSSAGDAAIVDAIDRTTRYQNAKNSIRSNLQGAVECYFIKTPNNLKLIGYNYWSKKRGLRPNANADSQTGRLLLAWAADDLTRHMLTHPVRRIR